MKLSYLLAAALTVAVVPGLASAQSSSDTSSMDTSTQESSTGTSSGSLDTSSDTSATGSTGSSMDYSGTGGSGDQSAGATGQAGATDQSTTYSSSPSYESSPSYTYVDNENQGDDKKKRDMTGISVNALGGVEGYTGSLAPRIDPGAAWGVGIGLQPSRIFGLELGYTGAANNITDGGGQLIRNGGNVNVKVSLAPTRVEPFVFTGVGLSRVDVRNSGQGILGDNSAGAYRDDIFGQVPMGGGLNFHLGKFTAGARASYNLLFDREFSPRNQGNSLGIDNNEKADSWTGVINLGGVF